MIVLPEQFDNVIAELSKTGEYGLDVETTGLRWYGTDHIIGVGISTSSGDYYFNFNDMEVVRHHSFLGRETIKKLQPIFENPLSIFFAHNAKFELHFLEKEGLAFNGILVCTKAMARVVRNDHLEYSLDSCGSRIGFPKSEEAEKYITENHHWEWESIPGRDKRNKNKFFYKIPTEILGEYCAKDAFVTRKLGEDFFIQIHHKPATVGVQAFCPPLENIATQEIRLTRVLSKMESIGIKIDRKYCEEAISFEEEQRQKAETAFATVTGVPFVDSSRTFQEVFRGHEKFFGRTDKNNYSFDEKALKRIPHPAASIVLQQREALKRLNTYYRNFLYFSDKSDIIHASILQDGTGTGRMSYKDPNLQNLPKRGEDLNKYQIRKAFVPRDGYLFVSIDYDQMEYKLMLDLANEEKLIKEVSNGMCVHEATARAMGVSRDEAKTINFMLLYGGGAGKLGEALGKDVEEARELRFEYFAKLPNVSQFLRDVSRTAEYRGFVFNWLGRRAYFENPKAVYKAANYLIQGGCADIVKKAMLDCDAILSEKRSRLLVQIHDELLFEIHKDELDVIDSIEKAMCESYRGKRLWMTCSKAYSLTSWGELEEWPSSGSLVLK